MIQRTLFFFILTWAIFLYSNPANAQSYTVKQDLNWQVKANFNNPKINATYFLNFPDAYYTCKSPATPVFSTRIPVSVTGQVLATLTDEIYVKENDPVIIGELGSLPASISVNAVMTELDHSPLVVINFVPVRKNPLNGDVELLKSFTISVTVTPAAIASGGSVPSGGSNKKSSAGSLLSSGTWYKFGVTQTGIYKIDYNFLKSVGIGSGTSMSAVKIYGRAGGMLPQSNAMPRDEDLVQNAVQVVSPDGAPDGSSYILFYAKGPTSWTYDSISRLFHHQVNYYSDTSYYFITADGDPGNPQKKIQNLTITTAPNTDIRTFTAYDYHELDTITPLTMEVKSGREWYGEGFSAINNNYHSNFNHYLNFSFPQADLSKQATIRTSTAARATDEDDNFIFNTVNDNIINTNNVGQLPGTDDFVYNYANANDNSSSTFSLPSTRFAIDVNFNGGPDDLGWLNYVEFNVPSNLAYIPGQFGFRNASSYATDISQHDTSYFLQHDTTYNGTSYRIKGDTIYYINIANGDTIKNSPQPVKYTVYNPINRVDRYHIAGAPSNLQVWDVTDFHNVQNLTLTLGSGEMTFISKGDVLREFVANDGSGFLTPVAFGKIANQNIHSMPQPDMVIVAYPDFIPAADSLAAYHMQHDGFTVDVVTPQQVYNEFSSGTQDVSAIRDMMRMFYNNASSAGKSPRFLLLFGAASFDYKNRIKGNTNFVPTYEGYFSLYSESSFCSDDYYTMVANNEGWTTDDDYNDADQLLQFSVGRLPVFNTQEAMDMVHKAERYNNEPKCMNDWRNKAVFIADDRESNTFVEQTEGIVQDTVVPQHPELNITKLYLDATPEENTAAGQLFPEINTDINNNMKNGCLVMDYIGHGGPSYLAVEKVVTIPDINSWVNPYNMPLFITATCQFGTFDDPTNLSAGDIALLNPVGGPFAMYSTTRAVEIGANADLNAAIFNKNLFEKDGSGQGQYIGSSFMNGKNRNGEEWNGKNFALLGDPAIRLALPQYNIKITNIKMDSLASDTFKALALMTISGEVVNGSQVLTGFNGDIYPTVFDKPQVQHTLGQAEGDPNDPDSPVPFLTQNSIIYKGHSSVTNGLFTFQFVVPRDISFAYGKGKISLYADNGIVDANGYDSSIQVGGNDPNAPINISPPMVNLFMNDTNFVDGGLVNQNPVLIARVYSQVGINTLGKPGHQLIAVLDSSGGSGTYVLDDYYAADKGTYKSGTITYPFANLSNGKYHLTVTVWDVDDNSAEASTDFIVANSSNLTVDKIFNYPNPFSDITTFGFDDNEPDKTLHVDIGIYDMRGNLVRDLQSDVMSAGDRQTIQWNGTTYGGARISSGMYIYRITVSDQDGQAVQKSSKLLFIK